MTAPSAADPSGGHAPDVAQVHVAARRIARHVHRTPVLTCAELDRVTGCELHFKCENMQKSGAFKFRGALNAVMGLSDDELARGVATHSSGNHAAALALAARMRGAPAVVVMPRNASRVKKAAARGYGAELIECEPSQSAREATLARVVAERGCVPVPPFDDPRVIAGQGTVALELLEQIPDVEAVIAPVGGGGLLAGIALVAHAISPQVQVLGAEPTAADDTWRSFQRGQRTPLERTPQTVADGLRTSVGAITFPIIARHASGVLRASEQGIVDAMRLIWERMKVLVEPSAAVPLAALIAQDHALAGRRVAVLLSGGNVDLDLLPWCCRREDCSRDAAS